MCTSMAINMLLTKDVHIYNLPGAPRPDDTSDQGPIDFQQSDLACTPDPTKTKTDWEIGGMDNEGGKVQGKATGLCNKPQKNSEQWNPWHPFQSACRIQKAQLLISHTPMCINKHLSCGLDNVDIFKSLYYTDILKCTQFVLTHLPLLEHLNCEPVCLAASEGLQIYRQIHTGNW